jgi:hypothetical protein
MSNARAAHEDGTQQEAHMDESPRMPNLSVLIPDEALAVIDEQAAGNRTACIIAASVAQARIPARARLDAEIAASIFAADDEDAIAYSAWQATIGDGLGEGVAESAGRPYRSAPTLRTRRLAAAAVIGSPLRANSATQTSTTLMT